MATLAPIVRQPLISQAGHSHDQGPHEGRRQGKGNLSRRLGGRYYELSDVRPSQAKGRTDLEQLLSTWVSAKNSMCCSRQLRSDERAMIPRAP